MNITFQPLLKKFQMDYDTDDEFVLMQMARIAEYCEKNNHSFDDFIMYIKIKIDELGQHE